MTIRSRLHLALWSGLALSLAHGFAPWLAPVAPVPLLMALRGASTREAAWAGAVAGAANAMIVAGFMHAGIGIFALVLGTYALTGGLFGLLVTGAGVRAGGPGRFVAVAPAAWVMAEWLHAHVPFSVPNLIGDTQHVGPLLSLARLGGTWAVGAALVALAAGLAVLVTDRTAWRLRVRPLAIAVGSVLIAWIAATAVSPEPTGHVSISVVQGGVPTWVYGRAEEDGAWRVVPERTYFELTREAAPSELTVWPETAVWRMWHEDAAWEATLRGLQQERGGSLLLGTPLREAAGVYANAAVLLEPDGAEHVVFKRRLALLAEASFAPHDRLNLLDSHVGRVGVVFCLETIAPQYARELAAAGAELLVVLADGSRFGATPVAAVHARRLIIRAVATGRAVVHAGQHGYSMVVEPDGTVHGGLPAFTAGVLSASVSRVSPQSATPYVRWGPWMVGLAAAVWFVGVLARLRLSRRASSSKAP